MDEAVRKEVLVDEILRLDELLRSGNGPRCTKPWTSLEERTQQGAVRPCCWYRETLGTIETASDVEKIWSGAELVHLRRQMSTSGPPPACPEHCPILTSRSDWYSKQEFFQYPAEELRSFSTAFLENRRRVMRAILDGDPHIEGTHPLRLKLYPSNQCNLRCVMCFLDFDVEVDRNWYSGGTFMNLLEHLEELKVFGGEPFFCRTSRGLILETSKPSQTHTSFVTNATLVTDPVIDLLERVRIGFVDVSLDAPDAETFAQIRLRGSFTNAIAGLRRLVGLSRRHPIQTFPVYANFVIQEGNYRSLVEFVELCHEVGADGNFSLVVDNQPAAKRSLRVGRRHELRPRDLDEVIRHVDRACTRASELGAEGTGASLRAVRSTIDAWSWT